MSKAVYRISKLAIADLDEIWVYTYKKWFKLQSDRYYTQILSEIEFVANNFMIGKSAEQTRKNYRVTQVKSHLIFYRIAEDSIIEIVRILHQKMDIKRYL